LRKETEKLHFHIELLDMNLEPHTQLELLKNAVFGEEIFWGQRKIYEYIQKLKLHDMGVRIDGIEPSRHK
jgi:hypothetical protein